VWLLIAGVWLLIAGVSVSLVTRKVLGDSGYGNITDMLLGINGAFGADWIIGVFAPPGEVGPSYKVLFIICGSAALPLGAHLLARFRASRTESPCHKEPFK
jgi:uncharacterized membrane protein YeaQ/YmgE (transglycosylase-associated protein family)